MKIALLSMLPFLAACTFTRSVRAIQPSDAVDTPAVWVEIQTNKDGANGVYRCFDASGKPICVKAEMRR